MAELVGLVSSSLALAEVAVKTGGAVAKLRRLWEEIQDVPKAITNLMKRIEIADSIIWDMERDIKEHANMSPVIFNDGAMRNSIELCRQAVQDISDLVDDLSVQIERQKGKGGVKRGIAKFKICLKNEVLADHEKRLQHAFMLLCAAQQGYIRTRLTFLPHVIVQRLREEQSQSSYGIIDGIKYNEEQASTSSNEVNENQMHRPEVKEIPIWRNSVYRSDEKLLGITKNKFHPMPWYQSPILGRLTTRRTEARKDSNSFTTTSYNLRLQFPSWIATKAWDIQMLKSISGWNIQLRTWQTVDYCSSRAFTAVSRRDPETLRYLLCNGLASPFERDEDGATLLHIVTESECARILVAAGLELNERNFNNTTAMSLILTRTTQSPRAIPEIKAFMHSLGGFEAAVGEEGSSWMLLNYASRVWRGLSVLRQVHPTVSWSFGRIFSGYHQLPFVTRVQEFYANPGKPWDEGLPPEIFRLSLWADGRIRKDDIDRLEQCDLPFLNIVSTWIGYRFWSEWTGEPIQWRETLRELLDIIGDLHSLRHGDIDGDDFWYLCHQTTPLVSFVLGAAASMLGTRYFKTEMQHAIIGWLSLLKSCKVDLVRYGRRERKALRRNHTLMETRLDDLVRNQLQEATEHLKIKDIRYGHNPKDWSLVWDTDAEELAGEFWQMTEEPRFLVPGAWVDD